MSEPQILTRFLASEEITVDREKRTLTFPFSSTRPVERWGWFEVEGEEILGRYDEQISHLPSHWNLERVDQKCCPFLKNHNRNAKLGVVQSVKFDSDRAFASVKLRRTKDADEFLDDLENGTAGGVSFGYLPKKYRVISSAEYEGKGWDRRLVKKAVLEAVETELYEVSNEEIPADPSVGFGKDAAFSLKSVEIVGNINFERGREHMPPENTEDLVLLKRENTDLRSQVEDLGKKLDEAVQKLGETQFKSEITTAYTAVRQRAEQFVREAKLSKAEFDSIFTGSSESHLRTILAMNETEARFELRHFERFLDTCEKRAPLLPTSLKTDNEPLPSNETQGQKDQEDADTYAKQFAEKSALPQWKTYKAFTASR